MSRFDLCCDGMTETNNQTMTLSRPAYFQAIIDHASAAGPGDSLAVATMNFEPEEPLVRSIIAALSGAAKRGATVTLVIDAYSFLLNKRYLPGPLLYGTKPDSRSLPYANRVKQALHVLQTSGVRTVVTNKPYDRWQNPFAGRSHLKYTVFNSTVYIGGCNLSDASHIDIMSRIDNQVASRFLLQLTDRLADMEEPSVKIALHRQDRRIQLNTVQTLLIDAGRPDESIIYKRAVQLIDRAQKLIVLTCQLFPNGKTADHLKAAQNRGVHVAIIFNHPLKHPFPFNVIHPAVTAYEELGAPRHFFDYQLPLNHPYLHAKLLYTDAGTLIGSHNYLPSGVRFGTAEVALESFGPEVGAQAYRYIRSAVRTRIALPEI